MKIITDTAAYVQKNDLAYYLTNVDYDVPASIFMKAFGNGIVIVDDRNRYDFVKFEEENEIEFFKQIDWIIDYNEVKDLSEQEFIAMGNQIIDEQNKIARTFNEMSETERQEHLDMVSRHELLNFKLYSLRDILWFKRGTLKMKLPNTSPIRTRIKKFFTGN